MKNPTTKVRMIIKGLRPDNYKKFSVRKFNYSNVCAVFYNETENMVNEIESLKIDLIIGGYNIQSKDKFAFVIIL